jgi:hypothetical protein
VHALLGPEVQLLAYDHNWDVPSYPLDVLAGMKERDTFVGTAWHCYGGEMAPAMDQLHEAYPQYEQHVTECTGGYPDGICDITKGGPPKVFICGSMTYHAGAFICRHDRFWMEPRVGHEQHPSR